MMLELLNLNSTYVLAKERVTMGTGPVLIGHCQKCHEPIGELSQEEFDFIVFEADRPLLCFDCDPVEAESIFSFFQKLSPGEFLHLGDVSLELREDELGHGNLFPARAHDAHARACLSSSTYLNRNTKNRVLFTDMREGYPCRVCEGEGVTTTGRISVPCSFCDGEGKVTTAIFLPLWLVGGVREDA